jgi:hypothetical protein
MKLRWAVALSVLIVLSTALPYAYHAAHPLPGRAYTGIEAFVTDQVTYLMWIEQVRRWGLWVENLYTADADDLVLANPLWAALGLLGRGVPAHAVWLYHGSRLLLGLTYLLLLWALVRRFSEDALTQWTAWLLAALGGGFAWVHWLVTGSTDLEGMWITADYMPEMWSYPSLLYFPHFVAGLLLLVATFHCLSGSWLTGRTGPAVGAGLSLGLLCLVHTYTAVTALAVLVVHSLLWLLTTRRLRPVVPRSILAAGIGSPFFAFQAWQVHTSPTLQKWAESNLMPSPTPLSYLLGAGLPGLVAVVALALAVRGLFRPGSGAEAGPGADPGAGSPALRLLLLAWVAGTIVLIFSGVAFERRCIEGLHIALALLAAPLVVETARRACRGSRPQTLLCIGGFIALSAPTALWYVAREFASKTGYIDSRIPRLARQLQATRPISGPPSTGDPAVIARLNLAAWLPVYGQVRVYAAHPQLTFDYARKCRVVSRLFAPETSDRERWDLLSTTGCGFIVAVGRDAEAFARAPRYWGELALDVGREPPHSDGMQVYIRLSPGLDAGQTPALRRSD